MNARKLSGSRNSVSKKLKIQILNKFISERDFLAGQFTSQKLSRVPIKEISIMELLTVSILVHLIYDGLLELF